MELLPLASRLFAPKMLDRLHLSFRSPLVSERTPCTLLRVTMLPGTFLPSTWYTAAAVRITLRCEYLHVRCEYLHVRYV